MDMLSNQLPMQLMKKNTVERGRIEHAMGLSAILDSLEVIIYVCDIHTFEILYVNRYLTDLLGNVVGKICWQTFQEGKTGPCEFCTHDKLLDEKGHPTGPYHWEFYQPILKQWLAITDKAIRWVDGRTVKLQIAYSISKRKEAESALRESEDRFRAIFQNAAIGMALVDLSGRPIVVNPALQGMLGYTDDELTSMVFTEFTHPEDAQKDMGLFIDMVENRIQNYHMEKRYIRKDGRGIWGNLTVSPVRDTEGSILYAVGMVEDVTERKQAVEGLKKAHDEMEGTVRARTLDLTMTNHELNTEIDRHRATQTALREERDRAQMYLDVAGVIMLVLNREGRVSLINGKGCEILGYSEDDILGKDWFENFLPPNIAPQIRTVFDRLMSGDIDTVEHYENPVLTRDGSKRFISWHNALLRDEDGRVYATLGSGEDITDRRIAREALQWELSVNKALGKLSQSLLNHTLSLEDLSEITLKYAKSLTRSAHGYVSSLDSETFDIVSHTLSDMMGEGQCNIEGKDRNIRFPLGEDRRYGRLWGHALNTREAFFTNSPAEHPESKGLPAGHVPLINFLSAPAIAGGELLGQIALANSDSRYTERDLSVVKRLADLFALAIQNKRAEQELLDHRRKLGALSMELSLVEEKERRELADNLHDHLGQNLAMAKVKLGEFRKTVPPASWEDIDEIASLLEQTIRSTRTMMFEMSPSGLLELGFTDALEWLAEHFSRKHGISVVLQSSGSPRPLNGNIGIFLFKTVRELLLNIVKHAETTEAQVLLHWEDRLSISIIDRGRGFDVEDFYNRIATNMSFGLFNIMDRIRYMGGEVSLDSARGKGTKVVLRVPEQVSLVKEVSKWV